MTDLYFTHDGTEAEVQQDIATIKAMLADAGVLPRHEEDGEEIIGDPRNVLGPKRGGASFEIDDGEGGKLLFPSMGRDGRWYLIIRTEHTVAALASAVGIGMDQIFDGKVIVSGGATLHLPPDDPDDINWAVLMREFSQVLGVWA